MLMLNRPFASDTQFGTRVAIFLVVGLVVGGTGRISGAVPGAFVYFFVPYFVSEWTYDQSGMPPGLREVTRPLFDWLPQAGTTISGLLFGVTLLVLMFLLPGGFVDGVRRVRRSHRAGRAASSLVVRRAAGSSYAQNLRITVTTSTVATSTG